MAQPVSPSSPQVVINGRTFCIATTSQGSVIGTIFTVGLFEKQADGSWFSAGAAAQYLNDGDCLRDIQAKGGTVAYIKWLKAKFLELFSALFPKTQPVGAEPTTDAQAKEFVTAAVLSMTVTNSNGVIGI